MTEVSGSQQLTIEQALAKAKKAVRQGDIDLALQLYTAVLQQQPRNPVAKKKLRRLQKDFPSNRAGQVENANPPQDQINKLVSLFQSGQLQQTEQAGRELLQTYPQSFLLNNVLGVALQSQGKLEEAVACYNEAIQIKPDYPEAFSNRGNALKALGHLPKAVESYDMAIQCMPNFTEAYFNRGNALAELGRLDEAVVSYDRAIQLQPEHAAAYSNRGNALRDLGQLKNAVASYDLAIQNKPGYAEAYYNRGNTLMEFGLLPDAVASHDKAIQLNPDYAAAYANRGHALRKLDRLDEAVVSYDKAIQIRPDYAEAYSNRGNALRDLGQLNEAVASYDESIRLKPDYAEAYFNRGNALVELGQLHEAIESLEKAIQIKPDYTKAYSNLLMALNYSESPGAIDYLEMAHKFGDIVTKKTKTDFSTYRCPPISERLRVGFVSGDLRKHPVGFFLESILSSIDSSKFELIAYPTVSKADALSERIKPLFSKWEPIYDRKDEDAARLIHEDGIHVLLDLAGHTADNRLPVFAYKPAPVQVSWLGYFATTGLNEMNYLLGDPHVTPPGNDEQFTEEVWRLPETRWCYTSPDVDVDVSNLPSLDNAYITFGCFNNLSKINDKVVELWAKILGAIPNSRLFLKAKQFGDSSVREGVVHRLTVLGIKPELLRIEGPDDHRGYFAAYNRVDITLDPFPFTGGTTSVESLWMGVPVLTLAGDSLVSRQGVGVLMNAGLPDWIAYNEEEYLAKAMHFASDPDKLAGLRAELRSQVMASPLFDAARFARNFEDALLEMSKRWAPQ